MVLLAAACSVVLYSGYAFVDAMVGLAALRD